MTAEFRRLTVTLAEEMISMEAQFWLQRWREGQVGFHRETVMPLLEKYWPSLSLPRGSRVFVPLAGKSKDMLWLMSRGFRVLGVELSPLAVEQFFEESRLEPTIHESPAGRHFVAGDIELICGDVFAIGANLVSSCAAVYDRAAVIALPTEMRRRYAAHLTRLLPAQCGMLLITVDYAQEAMDGPPFSVTEEEVESLYADDWQIALLERADILASEPRYVSRGLTAMHTSVFHLCRSV